MSVLKIHVFHAVFLFASIAGGCITPHVAPTTDTSLIRSYTFDLENQKHLDAPYVARFHHDGKLLPYVASEHVSAEKYPNLLDHPTLKTIETLFADYKPEVVIVEGFDTGTELSPKSILKKADECEQSKYRGCGEYFYAINMARKIGAAYITGEPKNIEIRIQIIREGYTAHDLLGFYLVRQIPQYKR